MTWAARTPSPSTGAPNSPTGGMTNHQMEMSSRIRQTAPERQPASRVASRVTGAAVRQGLPGPWTAELEAIARASIYHNPDGSVREKLDREHQKLILRATWEARSQDHLGRVRCPTLLLPSESSDPLLGERMARKRAGVEEAAQRLPDCTVHWVLDSVHDVQLHRPEVVAAALRGFLGGIINRE